MGEAQLVFASGFCHIRTPLGQLFPCQSVDVCTFGQVFEGINMRCHDIGCLHPGHIVLIVIGSHLTQFYKSIGDVVLFIEAGGEFAQIEHQIFLGQDRIGSMQCADDIGIAITGTGFGTQQVEQGAFLNTDEFRVALKIGDDCAGFFGFFHDIELGGLEGNGFLRLYQRPTQEGSYQQHHSQTKGFLQHGCNSPYV